MIHHAAAAGPHSIVDIAEAYFEANPKVVGDMTSIAQPADTPVMQCKRRSSAIRRWDLMQRRQAGGSSAALPECAGPGPARRGRRASGPHAAEQRRLSSRVPITIRRR